MRTAARDPLIHLFPRIPASMLLPSSSKSLCYQHQHSSSAPVHAHRKRISADRSHKNRRQFILYAYYPKVCLGHCEKNGRFLNEFFLVPRGSCSEDYGWIWSINRQLSPTRKWLSIVYNDTFHFLTQLHACTRASYMANQLWQASIRLEDENLVISESVELSHSSMGRT